MKAILIKSIVLSIVMMLFTVSLFCETLAEPPVNFMEL